MNKYIWLNPVVLSFYNKENITDVLQDKGFIRVESKKNNIEIVKAKYRKKIISSKKCIIDERCPLALEYVKSKYDLKDVKYPNIYPILIHTAIELSKIYCKENDKLFITTPCLSLVSLGKSLNIKNVIFITWKDFIKQYSIKNLEKKHVSESPIPPGFFKEYEDKCLSLSSKETIDYAFKQQLWKGKKILEMLYCKEGCHNGDGI